MHMKWFCHMTSSANDEKLSALMDEYGLEGYGFWWRVVEIVGTYVDEKGKHSVKLSPKKWGNLLGISPKKFQTLAEFCANLELIFIKNDKNIIEISIPNILKYCDTYTKQKTKNFEETSKKLQSLNNNILNNNINPPSLSPPLEGGEEERENFSSENSLPENPPESSKQTSVPNDRREGGGTSAPCGGQDCGQSVEQNTPFHRTDPSGYFNQLRTVYNRCKNEGSLSGWKEFKAYCRDKSNPDVLTLICDIEARSETAQWKDGYVPSLARYLREKLWEQPLEELSRKKDCHRQEEDFVAYAERMRNKQNSKGKSV